jgi:hypothetical protein
MTVGICEHPELISQTSLYPHPMQDLAGLERIAAIDQ